LGEAEPERDADPDRDHHGIDDRKGAATSMLSASTG